MTTKDSSIREVYIGQPQTQQFCNNKISTTKYTLLTFIPKNLFEQFSRVANLYFLLIAILQLIPGLSTLDPVTSILPLVFVVLVSMLKEAIEDLRRNQSDRQANSKPTLKWDGNQFSTAQWKDVQVGDLLRVECDESVPADLLVLYSPLDDGLCNIETTNLDGETNLKAKQAVSVDWKRVGGSKLSPDQLQPVTSFKAKLLIDQPNAQLYVFNGSMDIPQSDAIPLDNKNVILRTCSLRNTEFVLGVVCYTGHETKIMKNTSKTPIKRTKLEQLMNNFVAIAFAFQFIFCLFATIMYVVFEGRSKDHSYLEFDQEKLPLGVRGLLQFFTFLILLNTLIPISLYVTMEVVKLGQVLFINNDLNMYHLQTDTRANARTSNLNESLGQISYIFSDKTGTLTQNVMEFFKCSIGGEMFGKGVSEIQAAEMRRNGQLNAKPTGRGFEDDTLIPRMMNSAKQSTSNIKQTDLAAQKAVDFFTNLSICHTCLAEPKKEKKAASADTQLDQKKKNEIEMQEEDPNVQKQRKAKTKATNLSDNDEPEPLPEGPLSYKAASPDEGALVDAAAKVGFEFRGKQRKNYIVRMPTFAAYGLGINEQNKIQYNVQMTEIKLNNMNVDEQEGNADNLKRRKASGVKNLVETVDVPVEILHVLEFNSDRKRNSVIVRLPNKKLKIYSKGADATMIPRLTAEKEKLPQEFNFLPQQTILDLTLDHMQSFGSEGLRTLVLAQRDLTEQEFAQWEPQYISALNAMEDRAAKVDEAGALIEHDFELLGSTAIEDKLQEGVPDCIEVLRQAGMKIWVLTGDKQETAINIGFACKLLVQEMQMAIICGSTGNGDFEKDKENVKVHLHALAHVFAPIPATSFMKYALVIDGAALTYCLGEDMQSDLLSITSKCGVVICCRVSPKQKADVVGIVRDNTHATTLSIGDGANDVPMIQRAHVGVGISGNEGMQAVMASDYSIAQFRFLQNLLLVHGRLDYKRLSMVVLYSFYKNFAFTVTLFWFGWFSGFSATSMYESWYISLFNCIFTIAPIVVYGLGDQELRPERYGRLPATYALGRLGREATPWTFLIWIVDGIWTSFACFFSGLLMLEDCISYDGKTEDMWFFGNMICSGAILVVTLKILLESNFFTWIHALVAGLSYVAWFIVALIINTGVLRDNMYGAFYRDLMSPTFWLYLIIVPAIVIVPPYTLKYIFRVFKPSVDHVIRERELVLLKEDQQDEDAEDEIDQLAYGEKVEEEPSLQSNANEAFREDVQREQKEQGIYGQVDENGQRVKVPELKKNQQQQQQQSSQSQLQSKDAQQEKKQTQNINRADTISPPLMSGDRKSAYGTARKSERDTMRKPFVRQQSRAEADFAQFTKHWVHSPQNDRVASPYSQQGTLKPPSMLQAQSQYASQSSAAQQQSNAMVQPPYTTGSLLPQNKYQQMQTLKRHLGYDYSQTEKVGYDGNLQQVQNEQIRDNTLKRSTPQGNYRSSPQPTTINTRSQQQQQASSTLQRQQQSNHPSAVQPHAVANTQASQQQQQSSQLKQQQQQQQKPQQNQQQGASQYQQSSQQQQQQQQQHPSQVQQLQQNDMNSLNGSDSHRYQQPPVRQYAKAKVTKIQQKPIPSDPKK